MNWSSPSRTCCRFRDRNRLRLAPDALSAKQRKLEGALAAYGARGPYGEYFVATVKRRAPAGRAAGLRPDRAADAFVCRQRHRRPQLRRAVAWARTKIAASARSILPSTSRTDADGKPVVDWALLRRSV